MSHVSINARVEREIEGERGMVELFAQTQNISRGRMCAPIRHLALGNNPPPCCVVRVVHRERWRGGIYFAKRRRNGIASSAVAKRETFAYRAVGMSSIFLFLSAARLPILHTENTISIFFPNFHMYLTCDIRASENCKGIISIE